MSRKALQVAAIQSIRFEADFNEPEVRNFTENRAFEGMLSSGRGSVMMSIRFGLMLLCSVLAMAGQVAAQETKSIESVALPTAVRSPAYMRVFGSAQPPYGFVRFCDAQPDACQPNGTYDQRFAASPARLSELDDINRAVNRAIQPMTDLEIYGVNELWTIPRTKGDCEDFALLKRHLLIQQGWPSSSLLLTVVRDEKDEGHAVLTARTAQGDFILDNKVDDVKLWSQTPYRFVMRQSYLNPRVWVSLDPSDNSTPAAIAGVKPAN